MWWMDEMERETFWGILLGGLWEVLRGHESSGLLSKVVFFLAWEIEKTKLLT